MCYTLHSTSGSQRTVWTELFVDIVGLDFSRGDARLKISSVYNTYIRYIKKKKGWHSTYNHERFTLTILLQKEN